MRELEQAKMDNEGSSKEVKRREEVLWLDGVGECVVGKGERKVVCRMLGRLEDR